MFRPKQLLAASLVVVAIVGVGLGVQAATAQSTMPDVARMVRGPLPLDGAAATARTVDGIAFPDWRPWGWNAVGGRDDHLKHGRTAVTTVYQRGDEKIAYTLLSGTRDLNVGGLAQPTYTNVHGVVWLNLAGVALSPPSAQSHARHDKGHPESCKGRAGCTSPDFPVLTLKRLRGHHTAMLTAWPTTDHLWREFQTMALQTAPAGQAPAVATTPPTAPPTAPPTTPSRATPLAQARRMVQAMPYLAIWRTRLARAWGGAVSEHWSVRKLSDTNWPVTLRLSGPHGHQLTATWRVPDPLDRAPTAAELAGEARVPALNAAARKLDRMPTVATKTGDAARLVGRISATASPERSLPISVFAAYRVLTVPDPDDALLRGLTLYGHHDQDEPINARVGPSTQFVEATPSGQHRTVTATKFYNDTAFFFSPTTVTWIAGPQHATLGQLLARPAKEFRALLPRLR